MFETSSLIHSQTRMTTTFFLSLLLCHLIFFARFTNAVGRGHWVLLHKSIGITAIHMQLLNNDRVVIFDRTDFGQSNISLPNGKCRDDRWEKNIKHDCTAHSVEYNVLANSIRPLMVQTDVWCSSGIVASDGHLIQTGGFNDGDHVVRVFRPCRHCDWEELQSGLLVRRWYSSNHILPDGRAIVIGGRKQFNYEFYPKFSTTSSLFSLPFLHDTCDLDEENNLYPFVHLNVDGNLFIYANNRSILFDYKKNVVVKTYPPMPGGHPRNYPSTGSSVLLPLQNSGESSSVEAEVLICGGAPRGSFRQMQKGRFIAALKSCGRMRITDDSPYWTMETMPQSRVMGDMLLLPNGHVLIINGAGAGTAGWESARKPVLNPVIYRPGNIIGSRFEVQNPSSLPRLYHSSAILLRDGRILVGGNNPHIYYNFTGVLYPTDLSLEAFYPGYLDSQFSKLRPKIVSPKPHNQHTYYGQKLVVRFVVLGGLRNEGVLVTMLAPSFTTHSFSMNQRLLILNRRKVTRLNGSTHQVVVTMPNSSFLAPPGYYLLFIVHREIPSDGIWIQIL